MFVFNSARINKILAVMHIVIIFPSYSSLCVLVFYIKKNNFAGRHLDLEKNAGNKICCGSPPEFRF